MATNYTLIFRIILFFSAVVNGTLSRSRRATHGDERGYLRELGTKSEQHALHHNVYTKGRTSERVLKTDNRTHAHNRHGRRLSGEDGRLLFDKIAFDYVVSILSKADQPETWKPAAPVPDKFEISLITRTFSEREVMIFSTFPCFEVALPGSRTELV